MFLFLPNIVVAFDDYCIACNYLTPHH